MMKRPSALKQEAGEQAGRNLKAIVADVVEGFVSLNPLFLKSFGESSLKMLYTHLERRQRELRGEAFPYHEPALIRMRNLRLQRLFTAMTIVKNYARERRFTLV